MKSFSFLVLFLVLSSLLVGQQPTNVQKGGAAGTNALTGDLVLPAARTLTLSGVVTGTPASGTLNLSNLTLSLPSTTAALFAQSYNTIVVTGDSMSQSYLPPAGYGNDWPTKLLANSGWADRANLINLAISSETAANIAARVGSIDSQLVVTNGPGLLLLLVGHNDLSASISAATLQGYVTTIANAYRARGFDILLLTPPSVGNFSAPKVAERDAYTAWALSEEGDLFDYVVNLSSITEVDTMDTTHPTAAANVTIAGLVATELAQPFGASEKLITAPELQGTQTIDRLSLYSPGLDVRSSSALANRISDTAVPYSTGVRVDGVDFHPFGIPERRGVYVGDSGQAVATLASAITLSGDFFIGFWLKPSSRVFASGANTAPLLTDATGAHFGLTGGTGNPYFWDGSTNYLFSGVPAVPVGVPCFVGYYRRDGRMRACVNGVWGEAINYSSSISVDRLFGRTSGSYYQGAVYRTVVKTGYWDYIKIQEWMRGGGADLSGGVTTGLWLEWGEGGGTSTIDLVGGATQRPATFTTGTSTYYWLWPARGVGRPGISADNGNAAATLTVTSSVITQRWATAFTADRAVTLSTSSASTGSRFRIVREATATGAYNLNVGTGPLKALGSAGTWCEVEYDGSAWRLTAYGAL
jgi:lysophospholipase L1-like esterase